MGVNVTDSVAATIAALSVTTRPVIDTCEEPVSSPRKQQQGRVRADGAPPVPGPGSKSASQRAPSATATSGTTTRSGHDGTAFYRHLPAPVYDRESVPVRPVRWNALVAGDATDLSGIDDNTVALVVTSPPYHCGRDYEIDDAGAPEGGDGAAGWGQYLEFLAASIAEIHRILEPGGRVVWNVANLGRRPYRPLAADSWTLFENAGFLPSAEIVWRKGAGASGSAAFGSWLSPAAPAVRDVTERILVASKGRFDRTPTRKVRARDGWPAEPSITRDEFLAATLDVWDMAPERASRVGHPAPFPLPLPRRAIELFTYVGDLVVDPFVGSGTTAVAAAESGRRFVGVDRDRSYLNLAADRLEQTGLAVPVLSTAQFRRRRGSVAGPVAVAVAG